MFARWLLLAGFAVVAAFFAVRWVYSTSGEFPDLTSKPLLPSTELEVVAELPLPPGNIAVSEQGRVFFTFHPEASPEVNVAEWRDGKAIAFPSVDWQPGGGADQALNEVLSLRLYNNELCLLDNGRHGLNRVRMLAFDINSGELLKEYHFPRKVFPLGSHANDFRISPDGRFFYITDASLFARTPALIVYDRETDDSWRRLHKAPSVIAGDYQPVVQGRAMTLFNAFTVNPGVDGIALDQQGEWLYFASISAEQLYRVRTSDLRNRELPHATLMSKVEALGQKTMTDGMAIDAAGNVYLSDLEHSAIVRRTPDGQLQTLLRTADLRWPDGFSLANDGYLYVTCSALHQVIGIAAEETRNKGPFQIYRFHLGRAEQILAGDL